MEDNLNSQLTVNNTRAINSLIFQLLATRQALHALLASSPDPETIASQFKALVAQTSADLSEEPDQRYLLTAYMDSAEESLLALGERPDDPGLASH